MLLVVDSKTLGYRIQFSLKYFRIEKVYTDGDMDKTCFNPASI